MKLISVKQIHGIAGQVAYTVEFLDSYGDFNRQSVIGTVYGAPVPVILTFDTGGQTTVVDPGRFGDRFNEQWVRNFFGSWPINH